MPAACSSIRARCRWRSSRRATSRSAPDSATSTGRSSRAYGLNFDLLPNYPDEFVNPRSQVTSIGAEREIMHGLFAGADYVHQHWTDLDRSVDLNAPTPFDRTAIGQVQERRRGERDASDRAGQRRRAQRQRADESRASPITTACRRRSAIAAAASFQAALSYTLSKATNTTEPDGNGIGPNDANIARLGEEERGPSVVDQRHRAVITASYALPYNITAGTLMQFASARPFNATTGVDNNGDGANNDRPVVDGAVIAKSAFRGTGTQDVGLFVEGRIKAGGRALLLRLEGFNLFNHAQHPRTRADDLRRHRDGESDVRAGRRGGNGDQRASGAGEHRSAADVPVPGAVQF